MSKNHRARKGDGQNSRALANARPKIDATRYEGPIRLPVSASRDDVVQNLTMTGRFDWGSSAGNCVMGIAFRASGSGSFPATVTGNFTVSAPDCPDWSTLSALYSSFRILGVDVTVCTHIASSTDGFGIDPLYSAVVRENAYLTVNNFTDTLEFGLHAVGTGQNVFKRSMRMLGTDESEWVEMTNAYTAISPQPRVQVLFPDTAAPMRTTVVLVYSVQLRGRL